MAQLLIRQGKKRLRIGQILICLLTWDYVSPLKAQLNVRLKDILSFEGNRANQLIGYGLVVGLKGTGDSLKDSPYAQETIVSMLDRLGINIRDRVVNMKSQNMAAVMVTANLPPFARSGTRIDVGVSAIGTAKDLLGGMLLVTPLVGADGQVYAVAQGSVVTGGFTASGQSGSSVTKGVPTNGRIANGAIVEKEIDFDLNEQAIFHLSLNNPDFTTARRVAESISAHYGQGTAIARDSSSIRVVVPAAFKGNTAGFMTAIEQLRVVPDQVAKVVIDEQNGVIVMGENVRISTVAISHGNLTIHITETPLVSQPNPFTTGTAPAFSISSSQSANLTNGEDGQPASTEETNQTTLKVRGEGGAKTVVVPRTTINIDQGEGNKMTVLEQGVTLKELVRNLNALGVNPRDMITILRDIKAAGALQAEIEVI